MDSIATTIPTDRQAAAPRESNPRDEKAREGAAPPFSLAMASVALEGQAASSLKTHGSTPAGDGPGAGRQLREPVREEQTSDRQRGERAEPARSPSEARSAERPSNAGLQESNAAYKSTGSTLPSNSTTAHGASPAAGAHQIAQAATSSTQGPKELAAIRDFAASRNNAATHASRMRSAARPTEPQPAQQDFARLVAKRIGASGTSFDIRLDPPELGRVEGRFTIGDDGKAVLSLKFDNQSAFDLFARDQEALRTALAHAGLDLGSSDLDFSFSQSPAEQSLQSSSASAGELSPIIDEPYLAPAYSLGAINLRV